MRECTIEGCEEEHHAKGYCNRHYNEYIVQNTVPRELTNAREKGRAKLDDDIKEAYGYHRGCWR